MSIEIKNENGRMKGRVPTQYNPEQARLKREAEEAERKEWLKERNRILDNIADANDLTCHEYKGKVQGKNKEKVQEDSNKKTKRTIKGAKTFEKVKKFVLVGVIVSTTVASIVVPKIYKKNTYNNALNTVKAEIAQSVGDGVTIEDIKIYDNSSKIDGAMEKKEYVVIIKGEEFKFRENLGAGKYELMLDQIENRDVNTAIQIVGRAQNGNIFDAIDANRLVKEIEDGKINLSMEDAVKAREEYKEKFEDIGR